MCDAGVERSGQHSDESVVDPEGLHVVHATEEVGDASDWDELEPQPTRWVVFGVTSFALLMVSIDQTIVASALPAIQTELHAPINWSSWTLTIYALGQIATMPLWGRLSDQYGRKRIFLSAVVFFTVASLLCATATNVYQLVAYRALQSIGGGAFLPSATGIVSDQFGRDRDRALGMFSSIFPIGGIIGPILGGVAVTYWSWRGIFLINIPIGILLVVVGFRSFPGSLPRRSGRPAPTDVRGAVLLATTLVTTMYAVSALGSATAPGSTVLSLLVAAIAVAAGTAFWRHAARDPAAFVPMRLLRGRGFLVLNVINVLAGATIFGFGGLVPLYAHDRYGLSTLQSSTLLTFRAVGMITVAALSALALRRSGYRLPMTLGFVCLAVGSIGTWAPPQVGEPHTWLAICAGLSGIGMGMSLPASNNAGFQLAPTEVAAIAGLRGMFRQSGGILSVSVITAAMAHSGSPSATQAAGFLLLGMILALTIPFIRLVPDRRGGW